METNTFVPNYDALVGSIYQGALEDQPWQSFLPQLRHLLDAQVVSLILRPPADGDSGVILNCLRPASGSDSGVHSLASPDDWQVSTYKEQFFALDPFVNLPPGEVVMLSELMPDNELLASDYYQQYLKPAGVFHIMGADTIEPDGLMARLRIARGAQEAPFTTRDKSLCTVIVPHLQRAIHIHARLNRTESERDLYAHAVDQLSVATIILDELGRMLNCNRSAARLLQDRDGLNLHDNKLQLGGRGANEQLQEYVATVIAAQLHGEVSTVKALRVTRPSGRADLGLVIRPIPSSQWAEGQSSPCAAVFVSDPERQENASQQILSALFELTPAEANIAMLLARGLSLAEVSQQQSISQHTARAQLKAIFAKTGVSRQAELVRLVLRSVATLG